jgi:hypothetical protein
MFDQIAHREIRTRTDAAHPNRKPQRFGRQGVIIRQFLLNPRHAIPHVGDTDLRSSRLRADEVPDVFQLRSETDV